MPAPALDSHPQDSHPNR